MTITARSLEDAESALIDALRRRHDAHQTEAGAYDALAKANRAVVATLGRDISGGMYASRARGCRRQADECAAAARAIERQEVGSDRHLIACAAGALALLGCAKRRQIEDRLMAEDIGFSEEDADRAGFLANDHLTEQEGMLP